MEVADVAIIGGGVIGCATARALLQSGRVRNVQIIEKEPTLASHQSGRNSGVVHVGYNQKPGTLKANFVVDGSRRVREYCQSHGVQCVEDGILVVARTDDEMSTVYELHRRGTENGARVQVIDRDELKKLEPHAVGIGALYAPEGASFDSRQFVLALAEEARSLGAQVHLGEPVTSVSEGSEGVTITTNRRTLKAKLLINAAGLHADRFANMLGRGSGFQIIPFKGEYYELVPERRELVRSHIYSAPDLNFPFLGVHFSRTIDGRVIVGPGALLAGGRECYARFQVDVGDVGKMAGFKGFWKLLSSRNMRELTVREWKKSLFKGAVADEGRLLLPDLKDSDLVRGSCGIRAQLVSQEGELVDDLTMDETDRSIHILNAVSPALTCSLPFADHVVALAEKKL